MGNIFVKCVPHKLPSSAAAVLTDLRPFQQLESFAKQLLVPPPSWIQNTTVSTSCCDNIVSFGTNTAHLVPCGFAAVHVRKRITPLFFRYHSLISEANTC